MYKYIFWNRVAEINGISAEYFNSQYPEGEIVLFQIEDNKTVLIVYGCPPFFNSIVSHGALVTYCEKLLSQLNAPPPSSE